MPAAREPGALLRVARLYYLENKSQQEIADLLGLSRSNVSRMLTAAMESGIVEIRIIDPAGRDTELEDQLRSAFGLRDARVTARDRSASSAGDPLAAVGVLAGHLLLHVLDKQVDVTVALSWGTALQSMVWATETDHEYPVRIVQLVGGLSSISNEISGQELVRELASRLGNATYLHLHAPAALASRTARDSLLAEKSVQEALDEARQADIAVVGIGTPSHGSSAAVLDSLRLSTRDSKAFWARNPVGDIAARYFDASGTSIDGPVQDRVLAVGIDDLRAIPTVIGVAAGQVKAPGVLGALRGRLVDILVCDDGLARALLANAAHLPTQSTPASQSSVSGARSMLRTEAL